MFRFAAMFTLLAACGGAEEGAEKAGGAEECTIDMNALAGDTFVMYEAMPDQTYRENEQARMQFYDEDGELKVKYTVKSLSDVYTYGCELSEKEDGTEAYCTEEERVQDWCQALLVYDSDLCTRKELRKLGATKTSDEDMTKDMKAAREEVKKRRGTEKWDHFVLNNNNLGNKLQGRLWAKLDKKRCRLSVDDMYFTIFNGKGLEDTNPVGKNPFVKSEEEFLFEHCTDGHNLAPHTAAELPKKLSDLGPRRAPQPIDTDLWYHYVGEEAVKAEEGCTYEMDTFAQWRPADKGVAVAPGEKGKLSWVAQKKWTSDNIVELAPGARGGVFHMLRYKTCGGERELIGASCNAARVQ